MCSEFDLSDAQQEHALAVERLAPELAALRTELCLGCMNEGSFWKIYFVLVHPRLSIQHAKILSTPQVDCVSCHHITLFAVAIYYLLIHKLGTLSKCPYNNAIVKLLNLLLYHYNFHF